MHLFLPIVFCFLCMILFTNGGHISPTANHSGAQFWRWDAWNNRGWILSCSSNGSQVRFSKLNLARIYNKHSVRLSIYLDIFSTPPQRFITGYNIYASFYVQYRKGNSDEHKYFALKAKINLNAYSIYLVNAAQIKHLHKGFHSNYVWARRGQWNRLTSDTSSSKMGTGGSSSLHTVYKELWGWKLLPNIQWLSKTSILLPTWRGAGKVRSTVQAAAHPSCLVACSYF